MRMTPRLVLFLLNQISNSLLVLGQYVESQWVISKISHMKAVGLCSMHFLSMRERFSERKTKEQTVSATLRIVLYLLSGIRDCISELCSLKFKIMSVSSQDYCGLEKHRKLLLNGFKKILMYICSKISVNFLLSSSRISELKKSA